MSGAAPVHLVPRPHRDGVVMTLQNMLEIAERGKLLGVAAVDHEGRTRSAFEPGDNIATLTSERLRMLEPRDGDV